jgi:hypothetical protein
MSSSLHGLNIDNGLAELDGVSPHRQVPRVPGVGIVEAVARLHAQLCHVISDRRPALSGAVGGGRIEVCGDAHMDDGSVAFDVSRFFPEFVMRAQRVHDDRVVYMTAAHDPKYMENFSLP